MAAVIRRPVGGFFVPFTYLYRRKLEKIQFWLDLKYLLSFHEIMVVLKNIVKISYPMTKCVFEKQRNTNIYVKNEVKISPQEV